jgi:hypothetical protein
MRSRLVALFVATALWAPPAAVFAQLGGGLLPLPGFPQAPNNFSQPYKPDTFVNGPRFLPDT